MNKPEDQHSDLPVTGLITLKSVVAADGRGSLSSVLCVDDKASEERDKQSRELVISTLTTIAEELRRTRSPKQLEAGLKYNLILDTSAGFMAILKAPKDVIEEVLALLREIQTIEEKAKGDDIDPLYESMLKGPLSHFISDFESQLRTLR